MTVRRTRMSPEARRRQLVELGMEMAADTPLEAVTIEAVAERAGVSRALVFHYFESKQDFHLALIQLQAAELLECTAPDPDESDPLAVLAGSMSAYIDYVSENREGFVGLLRGSLSTDPQLRAVADDTRAQMIDRILAYAPDLGLEPTPELRFVVVGWIAFVEETLIGWLDNPVMGREEFTGLLVGALPALAGMAQLVTSPVAS